jgi:catechol 2,3-dioxygenase-like lactoylglutathione lyase family enzyme
VRSCANAWLRQLSLTPKKAKETCEVVQTPGYDSYHRLMGDRMRIGSIVIHCHEFDRMVTFWQNALHYVPRRPAKDGWVVLRDPEGKGPNLSFQARQTRAPRRSWLHLDLYTDRQDEEVNRLLQLGARRYPWRYRPGSDFVVLEDPDGNLFCVVQLP